MPTTVSSPPKNGCVNRLGWRLQSGALVRVIRGTKHLLRIPPAISFDAAEYDRLRANIETLRVDDAESGWRYSISAPAFDAHRQFLDRGFGAQWCARLERWTREPLPGHQLALELAS